VTTLRETDELVRAIEQRCGIPAEVTRTAIDGVGLSGDIYS
jgi:hypothetical protein